MQTIRTAKSRMFRKVALMLGLLPLLMAGDCYGGSSFGGVGNIISGVFELVIGILLLVD